MKLVPNSDTIILGYFVLLLMAIFIGWEWPARLSPICLALIVVLRVYEGHAARRKHWSEDHPWPEKRRRSAESNDRIHIELPPRRPQLANVELGRLFGYALFDLMVVLFFVGNFMRSEWMVRGALFCFLMMGVLGVVLGLVYKVPPD